MSLLFSFDREKRRITAGCSSILSTSKTQTENRGEKREILHSGCVFGQQIWCLSQNPHQGALGVGLPYQHHHDAVGMVCPKSCWALGPLFLLSLSASFLREWHWDVLMVPMSALSDFRSSDTYCYGIEVASLGWAEAFWLFLHSFNQNRTEISVSGLPVSQRNCADLGLGPCKVPTWGQRGQPRTQRCL